MFDKIESVAVWKWRNGGEEILEVCDYGCCKESEEKTIIYDFL